MKCFYETLNHILDLSACKESSRHKLISNRNLAMTSMTLSRISTISFYTAYFIECKMSTTHVLKKCNVFPKLTRV